MRVLATTNAAVGHLAPMAPTLRALIAAGHEVIVGSPASFAPTVHGWGFDVLACAEVAVTASIPAGPDPSRHEERLAWGVSLRWPREAWAWSGSLLEQARGWQPDLVVVEPVEHAGRVVAAALGVPCVEHGWGVGLPAGLVDQGARSLLELHRAHGSEPAAPHLRVDVGAASLQPADAAVVPRFRYVPWSHAGAPLPERGGRPRVLVTLGTFDNPAAAERLRLAVDTAIGAGAEVLAALGNAGSVELPGAVGLDWIDLPAAVATCDAVVHHGGAGSSWATLVAGRPAVALPQMGDQFRNAGALAAAGAAVRIDPPELTQRAVGDALAEVLQDSTFSEAARQIATENQSLPDPAALAELIAAQANP